VSVRRLTGVLLAMLALMRDAWGGRVVSLVSADYKDSADVVYLTSGGSLLAIAAGLAVLALLTFRAGER
jgi:hypothetical protein